MDALPQAFVRYEDLLTSDAVEAVYIPLPTDVRKEWLARAAAARKHVVCEKPCAPSAADLREMMAACRLHRVQFMDGVMSQLPFTSGRRCCSGGRSPRLGRASGARFAVAHSSRERRQVIHRTPGPPSNG